MEAEKTVFALQWENTLTNELENHGLYQTESEAMEAIRAWWNLNGVIPGYVRTWRKEGVTTVGYGSHFYFYKIKEVNQENYAKVMFPLNLEKLKPIVKSKIEDIVEDVLNREGVVLSLRKDEENFYFLDIEATPEEKKNHLEYLNELDDLFQYVFIDELKVVPEFV